MYDVAVVMPVYNESECIDAVIRSWTGQLDCMGLRYLMIVLNDGSRDNTAEVLSPYETNPHVRVVNKANTGHGPTILQGYAAAVHEALWVFQADSDNEMEACHFAKVWLRRKGMDAVIGMRDGRRQPLTRKLVSLSSRVIVRLFYGPGIYDVNCPFRLIRSEILGTLMKSIPPDTFAPNVAISGLLAARRMKVANIPIPHSTRQTGEVSIKKWQLLKAALKSCLQTILIRFRQSSAEKLYASESTDHRNAS